MNELKTNVGFSGPELLYTVNAVIREINAMTEKMKNLETILHDRFWADVKNQPQNKGNKRVVNG